MFSYPEDYRVRTGVLASEAGGPGAFRIPVGDTYMNVIASSDEGWEHVSVSNQRFVPRWEHMDAIKRVFWDDETAVMQLHPPRSEWVNCHPHCLHLWRPTAAEIPLPPRNLV